MNARGVSKRLACIVCVVLLAACSAERSFREGRRLVEAGQTGAGFAKLNEAVKLDPRQQEYRAYLFHQKELAVARLLSQGEAAQAAGRLEEAEARYTEAVALDATSERARLALETIKRERRLTGTIAQGEAALREGRTADAQASARAVLAESPKNNAAQALSRRIQDQLAASRQQEPQLDAALQRPITLEFRDTELKTVFELIARSTGINFFFDRDVRSDLRTTVYVRNTPVEDVIRFILVTNQLERKVLNQNTLLIYPNTAAKLKDYQELVTKSFYLHHADVKQAATLIKGMVKTKDVFFDEKLKLLIMRDTPDAVRMAEKLIAAQDLAESEVMLEVEVLEVASSVLTDLGLRYPDQVAVSLVSPSGAAGTFTLRELRNRDSSFYQISVTNPTLILNLKQQDGRTNTLANPRIRVKDGQKARVHIGDKVPVITTTLSATSFVSESVSYLDVGLKLEVEPSISLSNEVGIKVGLEVSSITREIRGSSGSLTYQIGTRNASTVLHLKDGETQILGGLISDDERKVADKVPGLGSLPVLGRLFSSHRDTATKSEVMLLITPRILRAIARPDARITEFLSGTESSIGAAPLVIRAADASGPGVVTGVTSGSGATPPQPSPVKGPIAASAVLGKVDPPTAPGASGPAPAMPAGIRLDLSGPSQVKAGEEFSVSVNGHYESGVKGGAFEIAYDPGRFRALRVEPGELLQGAANAAFKSGIRQNEGRVAVTYASPTELRGAGSLARIVLQPVSSQSGASVLTIQAPSVTDTTGNSLVPPTQPLSFSVAP